MSNVPGTYRQNELRCPCCRASLEWDDEQAELFLLYHRDLKENQRRGLGSLTVEHHGDLGHLSYRQDTSDPNPRPALDPLSNPQSRRPDPIPEPESTSNLPPSASSQATSDDDARLLELSRKHWRDRGVNTSPASSLHIKRP